MRMKVNILMLILITMITSIAFSSCSKDDEPQSVDNYYLVLSAVNTNLVDPTTGQSIAPALQEALIKGGELDSNGKFSMGKTTKESAINAFNESVENYKKSFNEVYAGKNLLPEGGYFDYEFTLQNKSGVIVVKATIRVTNAGATSH
jgi:hypothetical protein